MSIYSWSLNILLYNTKNININLLNKWRVTMEKVKINEGKILLENRMMTLSHIDNGGMSITN